MNKKQQFYSETGVAYEASECARNFTLDRKHSGMHVTAYDLVAVPK